MGEQDFRSIAKRIPEILESGMPVVGISQGVRVPPIGVEAIAWAYVCVVGERAGWWITAIGDPFGE